MPDFSEVKEVFLDFLHMGGVFLTSGYSIPPDFIVSRASYEAYCREQEAYKIRRAKYELKRQKYLEIKNKGDEVVFELTHKGVVEALKQKILSTEEKLPNNEFCLVSFDIPENTKKTRRVFRDFLKRAGFHQEHLSVWRNDTDVIRPLVELVKILKIEKWVKIYQARVL